MSTNERAPEPALTMKTIRDALANRTARTKALELAAADERDHGASTERVIARAERYFGFLAASTVEAAEAPQATSTQPAPAEPTPLSGCRFAVGQKIRRIASPIKGVRDIGDVVEVLARPEKSPASQNSVFYRGNDGNLTWAPADDFADADATPWPIYLVGDRIKAVNGSAPWLTNGNVYTVTGYHPESRRKVGEENYGVLVIDDEGNETTHHATRFVLHARADEFAKGDHVVATETCYDGAIKAGHHYVVTGTIDRRPAGHCIYTEGNEGLWRASAFRLATPEEIVARKAPPCPVSGPPAPEILPLKVGDKVLRNGDKNEYEFAATPRSSLHYNNEVVLWSEQTGYFACSLDNLTRADGHPHQ